MRKVLFNLHLYGALFVGVFIVIVGVTGSIMAFEEDIDHLLNPRLFRVQPQGQMLPPSALFAAAAKIAPGKKIGYLRLPQSDHESAVFPMQGKSAFLNPYTGELLGTREGNTVLSNIHQLHMRLLMGKSGGNVVSSVTGVLIFLVLTGVYLWWPLKRSTIKWKNASALRRNFDLHNVTGIYSAAFLVVLGVTGIVIHFDGELETWLHEKNGTAKIGKNTPSVVQKGATPITVDRAVEIAKQEMPGTQALSVSSPANPKGSYLIALRYPEDLTAGGRSWANVDQFSGKVVNFQNSRTVASGTKTIIIDRALHTGDILGYFSKVLMSLSSMFLVIQAITGYFMWWKKLRVRQRQADNQAAETMA